MGVVVDSDEDELEPFESGGCVVVSEPLDASKVVTAVVEVSVPVG